jgi:glycosyltransferase involved in cell wall biosynthesis
LADFAAKVIGNRGQESTLNVLLYGRSATHRGTGPDTYSSLLIGELAGRCTLGEFKGGPQPLQNWDLLHVLDIKHVPRKLFKEIPIPIVLDIHDTYWLENVPYSCSDRWARLWLARRRRKSYPKLMSKASRIVVHSRFVFKTLRNWLPPEQQGKLALVPYAVAVSQQAVAATESHGPRILFAGRDLFRKGFSTLIDAFNLLLKKTSNAELVVVGDEYRHSLRWAKKRCRRLPVRFLGGLSPKELHQEIIQADVVVLPSYTEAFGIVLLEAQALGIPVIGTRVGGIPETMAEKETGMLVPPFDPGALADAMRQLLTDPGKRQIMGGQGTEWVAKKFSPSQMADTLFDVYQSVTGAKSAGVQTMASHKP